MSLNYEQEWMRYYERNPSKAQLHLQNVITRFQLPEDWIHSFKIVFWQALVMEEVYQAQPSRRPTYSISSSNTIAVTFTGSASSVSALDRQDTCVPILHRGGARNRKRKLTMNSTSTYRIRRHPCLQFVPMYPSTLRNEILASPSPASQSFKTL
jgi:hypothetical protein